MEHSISHREPGWAKGRAFFSSSHQFFDCFQCGSLMRGGRRLSPCAMARSATPCRPCYVRFRRKLHDGMSHNQTMDTPPTWISVASLARPSRHGLIALSPAMGDLVSAIEHLARYPCPVLILGESGSGKEAMAEDPPCARPAL